MKTDFVEYKMFEDLAIQMKNLLTELETERENHGYRIIRAKNLTTYKERLGKIIREL